MLAGAADAARRPVNVMTRNMYAGADLTPVVQARTVPEFVAATATTWEKAQASDPRGRITALAREIADADPMVLALQEVELWQTDREPPSNDGSATPAETTEYDFLQLLLGALAAQGTPYEVVTVGTSWSAEAPTALGFDIKLTDRDAILAKAGLPADELSWSNASSARYAAALTLETAVGPFDTPRGYNVADFTASERSFRLVNTHLDPFINAIRVAQSSELLSGPLGDTAQRPVLAGDINSDPREDGANPYDLLTGGGFIDPWQALNPLADGLTCCFGEDLLDPDASGLRRRIDVVMTRNASAPALKVTLYGTDPDNRTSSGRWPSDHAGVSAKLVP